MKKLFFVYTWILITVGVMLTSIAFYTLNLKPQLLTQQVKQNDNSLSANANNQNTIVQNQDSNLNSIVSPADARAELVAQFLERYHSPLQPYDYFGKLFVQLADENNFDFRLLPAIAMQESNLCKNIPTASFNCLGFGIHEKGTLTFENFEANFERAAKELKLNYIDQGLTTPKDIMQKYTPQSNGSWADSVNQWMTEMRFNDREKGKQSDQTNSVLEYINK